MPITKTICALAIVGSVTGCFPPTQSGYSPAVVEQPQSVNFFYGTVIGVRPATLEYGYETGIGAKVLRPGLWQTLNESLYGSAYGVGIHFGGEGSAGGIRLSAGPIDVLLEASVPNLPAIEYTVIVEKNTCPPDPFLQRSGQHPAVIVVQNEYPGDARIPVNAPVFVRVVGGSGRVMPATDLPPWVTLPGGEIISVRDNLSAGPLPIPLASYCPPSYPPARPEQSYGYRQPLHQHWTIEP